MSDLTRLPTQEMAAPASPPRRPVLTRMKSALRGWWLTPGERLIVFQTIGAVAMLWAILGALILHVGGQPMFSTGFRWLAAAILALGVALTIKGRAGNPATDTARPKARAQRIGRAQVRTQWLLLSVGLLMLVIVAEINGEWMRRSGFDVSPEILDWFSFASPHIQFALLVVGIGLVTYGIGGRLETARPASPWWAVDWAGEWRRIRASLWADRGRLYALTAILIVATAVRTWQLSEAVHLFVDEIHFSTPVTHFWLVDNINLLAPFSSVAAFPYLYPYMQWLMVEAVGRDLDGLRAISAVFGIATVLATYWLTAELFDRRTALAAAAMLAVWPPHIQFSRLGLNNIADPFFGTMALYFLARGMKHFRDPAYNVRADFAAAGAMLGLTQYFYEGGRLLFPFLVFAWVIYAGAIAHLELSARLIGARVRRQRHKLAAISRQINTIDFAHIGSALIALVLVTAIVSAPVYYTLSMRGAELTQRLETAGLRDNVVSGLTTVEALLEHVVSRLRQSLLIHISIPEAQLYYGGSTPFLLGWAIWLWVIGMGYALWRLYRPGAALIVGWVLLTWLGNTLMHESRLSPRYVVEFPAIAIALALGLRCAAAILAARSAPTQRRLLAVGVSALATVQIAYFFGPHLALYNDQFRNDRDREYDTDDALFRSVNFPDDTHIHLIGEPVMATRYAVDLMRFLNDRLVVETMIPSELTLDHLLAQDAGVDHAFYIERDDPATLALIREVFPNLTGPYGSPWDVPDANEFLLYYAEATELSPLQPAE
jgi:hypothetical protein